MSMILIAGYRTAKSRPPFQYRLRVIGAEAGVVMTVVAGALLLAGHPGGLWCQVIGTGLCITAGVFDAWVLLVEILR